MPFGIGGWEPIILLLVLVVLFGPSQLPKIARNLGLGVREMKDSVEGLTRPVRDPLGVRESIRDPLGLKESARDPLGLNEASESRSDRDNDARA